MNLGAANIRKLALGAIAAAISILPLHATAQSSEQRPEFNRSFPPFKIIGNIYYVGTNELSVFLIVGPKGSALIDSGLPESAPLIEANIRKLGFKLRDIKYLFVDHTHGDHAGGLAEIKKLSGAKLVASAGEKPDLESGKTTDRPELFNFPPVNVDQIIKNGERIRLGPLEFIAYLCPGHTRGSVCWVTNTEGKRVMFATSLTVAGENIVNDRSYSNAAEDFRATFRKMRTMKADVFLSTHTGIFHMQEKRSRQLAGDKMAFVDPRELQRQVSEAEEDFNNELNHQRTKAKLGIKM